MCLAVPGRVVEWLERASPFASASVEFGGVRRRVSMECVPEAEEGDYVLVHAGMAISRMEPGEAARVLALWQELAGDGSEGGEGEEVSGGNLRDQP